MRDPIEHYSYPREWIKREANLIGFREVRGRIESGLYILTHKGWLRRGITTATTASASAIAAIASLFEETDYVKVWTPSGVCVEVRVDARDGLALVRKFSGDHLFDVTDGIEIKAEVCREMEFGEGVGRIDGEPSVSESAMGQLLRNIQKARKKYGYEGWVEFSIPRGREVAEKTDNRRFGVVGGISILGTTGFVEPWCEELVEAKIEIAKQYDMVALTTGRKGWRWARENLPEFTPVVMGVHFDRALEELEGEVVIAGLPSLIVKWAFPEMRGKILKGCNLIRFREGILEKARQINPNVADVILLTGN